MQLRIKDSDYSSVFGVEKMQMAIDGYKKMDEAYQKFQDYVKDDSGSYKVN